jgi:hypothetical protein
MCQCVYLEYGRPERLEADGAVEDLQSRRHSTRPLELGDELFSLLFLSISFHLVGVRCLHGFSKATICGERQETPIQSALTFYYV